MVSGLFRILVAYACASQVWSQRFWMLHYKSRSPKRTRLWSCSTAIRLFDLGPMTKQTLKAGTKVKTTKKTISKSGRQQFTGSADLRGTQSWPQLMDMHACMYPEAQYHSFINSYLHACMHAQDLYVPLLSANHSSSASSTLPAKPVASSRSLQCTGTCIHAYAYVTIHVTYVACRRPHQT